MFFKFLFEFKFVSNKLNVFVLKILPDFRKMCKRLPFSQIHSCKRNSNGKVVVVSEIYMEIISSSKGCRCPGLVEDGWKESLLILLNKLECKEIHEVLNR